MPRPSAGSQPFTMSPPWFGVFPWFFAFVCFANPHLRMHQEQEDRMESFFLSETLKYLYLLFDDDNPFNKRDDFVFSTQV
jgi:hypothetical protein